jgi:hypothetical protein
MYSSIFSDLGTAELEEASLIIFNSQMTVNSIYPLSTKATKWLGVL